MIKYHASMLCTHIQHNVASNSVNHLSISSTSCPKWQCLVYCRTAYCKYFTRDTINTWIWIEFEFEFEFYFTFYWMLRILLSGLHWHNINMPTWYENCLNWLGDCLNSPRESVVVYHAMLFLSKNVSIFWEKTTMGEAYVTLLVGVHKCLHNF